MLDNNMLTAVTTYMADINRDVELVVAPGEHTKRAELIQFLEQIASCSPRIAVVERAEPNLRSPVSFALVADGQPTGISFSGIPGGHEFNSLILALVGAGGRASSVDEGVRRVVEAVAKPIHFEVFVSLSCHNCPEVVQALNGFALLNPMVSCEMIDGGLFPALIAERDIQGVPSVYANGELFANGKIDAGVIVGKLLERQPQVTVSSAISERQDVTIIGGGPAGVSAAIYSARKGLKVTVIADRLGGQVKDTMAIENMISVPQTDGPTLAAAMESHLGEYPITVKAHLRVERIERRGNLERIVLNNGEVVETRTVIVATGARWRELGVPGERDNIGSGVAYCPHCDGPFFAGKDVAVIGGGNSGIEAALDLAGIVKSVTVFEFMDTLKADQVLVDKARSRGNITIHTGVAVQEIVAVEGKVSAIAYQQRATGERIEQPLQGVFVQIGLVPNGQFVEDRVAMNERGEIIIDERCATSAEAIFAAGDVTTVPYKQISVSMGEGAKAALSAYERILLGGQGEAQPVDAQQAA